LVNHSCSPHILRSATSKGLGSSSGSDGRLTSAGVHFTIPYASGEPRQTSIPVYEIPYKYADDRLIVDTVLGQDMMAWVTQGDITERLGTSDKGIILYRQVLLEQIERVQRGEDPVGVIRDPARNTPFLSVPRERNAFFTHAGGMVAQPDVFAEDPLAFVRGKRDT
jgi:hypothetical protein